MYRFSPSLFHYTGFVNYAGLDNNYAWQSCFSANKLSAAVINKYNYAQNACRKKVSKRKASRRKASRKKANGAWDGEVNTANYLLNMFG